MIATLSGKVLSKNIDRAVVDVGGVGYEVIVSSDTIARMVDKGEEAFFFIHTNVREDAITLYGFIDEQEKQLFLILKTVSGIGPKLALAMLSGLRVAEICQAIINGDIKRLTTLQGVGKKTAERLCVELKEKVSHLSADISVDRMSEPTLPAGNSVVADALSALSNLGYPDSVARSALSAVKKQFEGDDFEQLGVETLIRESLRVLA
jgi:Holliday junction DNA helicase RuvA